MTKAQQSEQAVAFARLRETLKPGTTVYTQLKHVSRSGMQRVIQLVVIENNGPRWIGWTVAKAPGMRYDREREGIVIGGCGMDMGFELVYNIGRALFRNGFDCVGERCPSNDHSNGDRNYRPHKHTGDGGYALHHRWL
jgi:hypothetical protein